MNVGNAGAHRVQMNSTPAERHGPGRITTGVTDRSASDTSLRGVCRDFEALFIRQLLKTMRSTGGWDGFLKESHGEAIFASRRDAALADVISKQGALGIARMLYSQLQDQHQGSIHQPHQVDHHG